MRPTKPKFQHSPEVYQAIIDEHRQNAVRIGERLMACGWTLADAGWAAANWDLRTLAAAVATERAKHGQRLTNLSEDNLAKLRTKLEAAALPVALPLSRKTTWIIRHTTPRIPYNTAELSDPPIT